ncbi:MAG TPA: hypothetical protein V6D05_13600 [Stenomitos sp.]
MADLRTFVYLDTLQPQVAAFLGTVSQGFLPVEGQASLFVEIAPGIEINLLTDAALKSTKVKPGMLIVERDFGVLEAHHDEQYEVRAAGEAVLDRLGLTEDDRIKPRIVSATTITGTDAHQTMLINRMRHGEMIKKGETLFVLEVHPAGYALLAANEAEKAAHVNVLEVRAFGAFGRVYLAGDEANIEEGAKAAVRAIESLSGKANAAVR